MEIQLNKDLNKFQDNFCMGLNFRQTVCAGIGIALGAAVYFVSTKKGLNTEVSSWLCALIALPFFAFGFVSYQGMTFEQLVKVWLQQYLYCPNKICSRLENINYVKDKEKIEKEQIKEAKRRD